MGGEYERGGWGGVAPRLLSHKSSPVNGMSGGGGGGRNYVGNSCFASKMVKQAAGNSN